MKNKCLSLLFFIFFLFQGLAQNTDAEQLKYNYEEHFKHRREALHLHLNKTVFYVGEEIWWTAYAYNKKVDEPSSGTTNLHCGIYDINGKLVKEAMFLVEDGTTHGSFALDDAFESGTYFVRATTSWMQNFEEDLDFEAPITVIKNSLDDQMVESTNAYDLKILPEGGHIVKNTQSHIGVKLTYQTGKGVTSATGKIYDSTISKVADISLNDYGIGKFILPAKVDFPLTMEVVTRDGTVIKKEIPAPKEMGIALNVNNIVEDKLFVSLKTNQPTLESIQGKAFYLAVHRDGLMALKTVKINSLEKEIKIDKSQLLNGTNIVTLFDEELNPIAERLVFNFKNIKVGKLAIASPERKNKDSIAIRINAFSKNQSDVVLSISALPSETKANTTGNSIISNFLLKPYLKTEVENPARYFNDTDRKKAYELDLVLLTQGWSSYDWDSIFNGAPEIQYPFEHGVALSGTINSKIRKGDRLVVNYGDVANMLFVALKDSTTFQINNLFNYNKDTLLLALHGKNKKLRKAQFDAQFLNGFNLAETYFDVPNVTRNPLFINTNDIAAENPIPPLFIKDKTIALKGVEVTEERIEKKLTRASPLVSKAFFSGIKIGEKEVRYNVTLAQLIDKNGFRVIYDLGNNVFTVINKRPASGPVRVYLDDFLATGLDIKELAEVPINQFDEIYFERNGLAGDVNASGGVIRIYRKGGNALRPINSSFAEKLVENSFTRPKKFYRPDYVSYDGQDFKEYGVLHWEPHLTTNAQGQAELTIPDNGIKNLTLFVEGMAADGTLLSHVQQLSLD